MITKEMLTNLSKTLPNAAIRTETSNTLESKSLAEGSLQFSFNDEILYNHINYTIGHLDWKVLQIACDVLPLQSFEGQLRIVVYLQLIHPINDIDMGIKFIAPVEGLFIYINKEHRKGFKKYVKTEKDSFIMYDFLENIIKNKNQHRDKYYR